MTEGERKGGELASPPRVDRGEKPNNELFCANGPFFPSARKKRWGKTRRPAGRGKKNRGSSRCGSLHFDRGEERESSNVTVFCGKKKFGGDYFRDLQPETGKKRGGGGGQNEEGLVRFSAQFAEKEGEMGSWRRPVPSLTFPSPAQKKGEGEPRPQPNTGPRKASVEASSRFHARKSSACRDAANPAVTRRGEAGGGPKSAPSSHVEEKEGAVTREADVRVSSASPTRDKKRGRPGAWRGLATAGRSAKAKGGRGGAGKKKRSKSTPPPIAGTEKSAAAGRGGRAPA